jgi:hypothetical protein
MKSLIVFVVGGLLFGASALGLGYCVVGEEAFLPGGVGFALTFVPAAVALAWVLFTYQATPEMQLLACLGSSGVRMAIGLGGGLLLTSVRPQEFNPALWLWLLVFYPVLLVFEMTLVVWRQPKLDRKPQV